MQQSVQLSAEKAQHALAMRAAAEEHERAMSVMRDEADSLRRCILERDDEVAALRQEAEKVAKAHREQVHALNTKLGDMEVQSMFMFNTDGDVSVRSPKFSISGPSIAQASPTRLPQNSGSRCAHAAEFQFDDHSKLQDCDESCGSKRLRTRRRSAAQ